MENHPSIRSPTQSHFFHLVSYLDEPSIGLAIMSLNVRHWAYIYHNCDRYTEGEKKGELKEPHYHILISMVNKSSLSSVLRPFKGQRDVEGKFINTFGRSCTDKTFEFAYLDHSREDCVERGDFLYHRRDIKTDCINYWISSRMNDLDSVTECFMEYYNGVPYSTLLLKYGKIFIYNLRKFEDLACSMASKTHFDPDNFGISNPNEYNFLGD